MFGAKFRQNLCGIVEMSKFYAVSCASPKFGSEFTCFYLYHSKKKKKKADPTGVNFISKDFFGKNFVSKVVS